MARFAATTTAQTLGHMAAGAAIAGAAVLGVGQVEKLMQQPQAPTAPPQTPPTPTGTNSGWMRTLQQRGQLK